jgi:hypothetical protein
LAGTASLASGESKRFLVAHENALDTPVGYVRSRVTQDALDILELASEGDSPDIAHSLLTTSAMQLDGHLLGHFPPSMRTIFLPGEFGVRDDPGLMGRVINLAALASALAPQWVERLLEAGRDEVMLALSTSAGAAVLRVSHEGVQLHASTAFGPDSPLNERECAHLLFHGFDERAKTLQGNRADAFLLRILFPEQDFVIWQADQY